MWKQHSSSIAKVALVTVFTAVSLGTYYPMAGLANVKLTDSIDFIVTYVFGLEIGLPTTILTRTVYASFNPYGAAPITLILVLGDCFYPLAAYLARRAGLVERVGEVTGRSLGLGIMGFLSALGFDLVTNFAGGLIAVTGPNIGTYLTRALVWGLVTMNFPLPMGILHELSDFLFFSTVVPIAILVIKRSAVLQQGIFANLVEPGKLKR